MSLHRVKFSRHSRAPDGTLLFTSNAHGDNSGEYIQAADAMDVIESLADALDELADLMQGVKYGDYKPGSLTLQPAREALANYRRAKE